MLFRRLAFGSLLFIAASWTLSPTYGATPNLNHSCSRVCPDSVDNSDTFSCVKSLENSDSSSLKENHPVCYEAFQKYSALKDKADIDRMNNRQQFVEGPGPASHPFS